MEDIAEELRRAIGRFVRATRAHADTLPPTRAEVMGVLSREGPQTIARLAARRGVKHQSMSRIVGELEALGFATREPNPADGRGFVITLTPGGEAALEADRGARRDWVAAAIEARLTPAERAMLGAVPALLDRLAADGPVGESSEKRGGQRGARRDGDRGGKSLGGGERNPADHRLGEHEDEREDERG